VWSKVQVPTADRHPLEHNEIWDRFNKTGTQKDEKLQWKQALAGQMLQSKRTTSSDTVHEHIHKNKILRLCLKSFMNVQSTPNCDVYTIHNFRNVKPEVLSAESIQTQIF
jgi:hypothetical protein